MNKPAFFAAYRTAFGPLRQDQVDGLEFLLDRLDADGPDSLEQAAYILATAKHETADTYQPVREAFKKSEEWRKQNLRYWPWYGRGYVQLTWRDNYVLAGKKIGLDLTTDPDEVMQPLIAYSILLRGMLEGWFRKHKLADHINDKKTDYVNAREIVNGKGKDGKLDKAELIAGYATAFDRCLHAAQYAPARKPPTPAPLVCDMPTLKAPFQRTMATEILRQAFKCDLLQHLELALKAFQKQQDLPDDGICGPQTWAKLFTGDSK
jgi:hypothetical protein